MDAVRRARVLRLRLRRAVGRAALAVDPTPWLLARRAGTGQTGVLCCVTRVANRATVGALVDSAVDAGLEPRLWALDEVADGLAPWTVGRGPGLRQELLNRLVGARPLAGQWLVFADDDALLPGGRPSIRTLLAVAERARFDLVQPGHDGTSETPWSLVRSRPGLVARRTAFVEIGPVVALHRRAWDVLLPLDDTLGMGWGQDYRWARAAEQQDLTIGIVDGVRVHHPDRAGTAYDAAAADAMLARVTRQLGYSSVHEPHRTLARWPISRRTAPWSPRP